MSNDIANVVTKAAVSQEPYYLMLVAVACVVAVIAVIAKIVVSLFHLKTSKAQALAEGSLYSRLSEQTKRQSEALDKVYVERSRNISEQVTTLKVEFDKLQARLEDKERLLAERDATILKLFDVIRTKDAELMSIGVRVRELEMRLALEDRKLCEGCDRYSLFKLVGKSTPIGGLMGDGE